MNWNNLLGPSGHKDKTLFRDFSINGQPCTAARTGDGPLIVVSGDSSFAVNEAGEQLTVAEVVYADCGMIFDEYVKRALPEPFPYSALGPTERTVENLWKGRRLRLLTVPGGNKDDWKTGQVVKWRQWNTGPFCRCTYWDVTIQLDQPEIAADSPPEQLFRKGDLVKIHGLVNAKKHNGKVATVQEYLPEEGRFGVQYGPQEKLKICLGVKPCNLERVLLVERQVSRMNLNGGGTLEGGEEDDAPLLSFEWCSPADPEIDLNGKKSCPTCRMLQPYEVEAPALCFENQFDLERDTKCPVCTETTVCLRLASCGHFVCQPCWEIWWHHLTDGKIREDTTFVEMEDFDPDQLAARRAELLAEFEKKTPKQYSAPDCNPENGMAIMTKKRKAWNKYENIFVNKLINDWNAGPEGRKRFQRTLMESPILLWNGYVAGERLIDELPVAGLEVLARVMDKRFQSGCFLEMSCWCTGREGVPKWRDAYTFSDEDNASEMYGRWTFGILQRIGYRYEKVKNYRAALPWLEEAERRGHMFTQSSDRKNRVSAIQFDLGANHDKLGNFSTALQYYDKSLSVDEISFREKLSKHRKDLLEEMKSWTGTTGKMTPER